MRAVPIAAAVVGALGLGACPGRDCPTLTVEDTVQVYESDGQIMVKRDTQPKPYGGCLKLKPAREARVPGDTQPRP